MPDLIAMARLGSQPVGWPVEDYAVRSPDGSRVAVVVQRGDLVRNLVIYTLLIFRAADSLHLSRPDTVLTFASSSNRPGIAQLTWLADNATLAFLGEHPGEVSQVYTVDTRTQRLRRLTRSSTPITSFTIGPRGDPVLYAADAPADTSDYAMRRTHGFVVEPTQFVGHLVAGQWAEHSLAPLSQTFIQHAGRRATPLPDPGPEYAGCDAPSEFGYFPSISPSAAAALVYCIPRSPPSQWQGYTNSHLRRFLFELGYRVMGPRPMVLDLIHDQLTPLLDAPVWITAKSLAWAPDGRSVVLANTFLPLDVRDSAERTRRAEGRAVVEVDLATRAVTVIAHRDSLRVLGWDPRTNTIALAPGLYMVSPTETHRLYYRKTPKGWIAIADQGTAAVEPQLIIDQGMNTPPRLVAVEPRTGRRALVFDPNPKLERRFRFGEETVVHWETKDRTRWSGGLYYPPGYVAGRKYPLVIQTHGFDSTEFAPEGASASGYAAQPLAAQGILVLQMDYLAMQGDMDSPREGPSAQASFEAAIDHLDSLGLIDRTKVGLQAWSRTDYHVLYTLTHSQYNFAAALITDGVNMSYLQYLVFQPPRTSLMFAQRASSHEENANGGPPLGPLLELWREHAPGFNLDHVHTPLRMTALGSPSLIEEWEVYAGLLLQHKPVELLYLPDGAHGLVKPRERLTSQQGTVDWFRFWLKGEEELDPAKAGQYARWRELRTNAFQ